MLASDTAITTGSTSTLSVTSPLVAPGRTIAKAGAGTLQLTRVEADLLNITGGTVTIAAQGAPNSTRARACSTICLSRPAQIDLQNNALVNNYTTAGTLPDTIRQMIQSGRITTSLTADGHGLGFANNTALGRTTFGGMSVGPRRPVLIGYTFVGDANLDGRVNGIDFNSLAANYGGASPRMDAG